MVPRLLRLRNFMSYGDEPVEVDFEGLHLACLSGGNGNGKSALLDAITWALWGESRAKREDDLIYHGATEMEVELQFAVGGGRYRVLRKRTRRPSGGTTALELQALSDGGAYTPITGGTMHETQARLYGILKLDYETFINSTFLLQGKADQFTVKPPGQRKEILGKILGLEEYEQLATRARERARDLQARGTGKREAIAADEIELARHPALHTELVELERQRAEATAALRRAEEDLAVARLERQRLQEEERALEREERDIAARRQEMAMHARRRDEAQRAAREAVALLADEARIMAGAAELRQVRAELAEINARASKALSLERAATAAQQEIQLAEASLRGEYKAALADAERAANAAAEEPALRRLAEEYAASEARIPAVEAERFDLAQQLETLRCHVVALRGEVAGLEAAMKPLRERLKLLQEKGAACPVCRKPMDEAERQRIYQEFVDEGVAKKQKVAEHEACIADTQGQITALQGRDRELAATLGTLQKHARESGAVRHKLEVTQEAGRAEREARARAEAAGQALRDEDCAHEARARLRAAQEAIGALGYDANRHAALQAREAELAALAACEAELAAARERHAGAQAAIATHEEDLARLARELEQREQAAEALRAALAVLPTIDARLAAHEEELTRAREVEEGLSRRVAALSERLRGLDALEESLREKRAELARMEQEGDAYAELGRLFGKTGIQAMIIDAALPELERGANAILARMSDNSMQVRFDTQKQSANKKDVLETLDIQIADANGTRPYEMFSGGEAFRVNFAIRIALSRLLAERAGAQVQMLVIDEGFGTQDSQGRERLVEAINSVAADFEKIIIITHIDELKDLFNTRIDVVKGLGGSRVTITAA